jgi:CheY-like chemotaxis protein
MLLRPAEPEDAIAVARVHVRSWQAAYRTLLPHDYLDQLRPQDRAKTYDFASLDPVEFVATRAEAFEVLLVEDSPGDVRLTREASKDAKVHINLSVAPDGVEAMAFLRREGKHAGVPRPDLILLDLNLPRKSGREVLEEIKGDPTLMSIPVVVLTTSMSEQDVLGSYLLHVNCFITKPVDLDGFLKVVKSIDNFWLSVAELPNEVRS